MLLRQKCTFTIVKYILSDFWIMHTFFLFIVLILQLVNKVNFVILECE